MQVIRPRLRLAVVHHGQPVVGPNKPLRAVEARRRHAHHGKRMLVELYGGADDARISKKRGPPQSVAQHHIGSRIRAMLI
jgi:hypothetical protein